MFSLLAAILSSLLAATLAVPSDLSISSATDGTSVAAYTQLQNEKQCLPDATADAALGETGGEMDFLSDSLEWCAKACSCRQGCVSFNWVKPDAYDGTLDYVVDTATTPEFGSQGKCTLLSSNCEGDFAQTGGENVYAFQKADKTATDVQLIYPRSGVADGEKEVTDQVACALKDVTVADGYRRLGGGGPGAGICASGGGFAKITGLDANAPAGTGLKPCQTACDGDSNCKMFNLRPDGSCLFRNTRCKSFWSAETAKEGWTSYIKDIPPTSAPSGAKLGTDPTDSSASRENIALVSIILAITMM
jgi:hypothetical protein